MGATPELNFDNVNLMDKDIQQLLAEAEQRLCKGEAANTEDLNAHVQSGLALPNIPKLSDSSLRPYVQQRNDFALADSTLMVDQCLKDISYPLKSEHRASRSVSYKDKPTAGSDWFDLPATELTPELKRDLQLLRMRSILDPKRHYKKENGKAQPPKFSQVGTIIEGPTEFFSGRIVKRDRKKTFVEEAMVLEQETKRFEARYKDVQDRKSSGKKAFYKSLQAKRKSGKNRR
ncbi:Fcf2 pre-rRNA processing-domain-containing protein [Aspergillus egyptiacus]|nr:Fcf2 pre-rRNA processing-domain-containing protein [Aspergillus egyptiacus]